ncbi:TauD/TfdA family dioxygenase [Streptomyces sp. NPDC048256]|uniref:TauD/TfdA dioxygenase family protein n=1 Tax=Streptomyces sp. NPDC048256 TaxID=3154613 RepID=UPI0033E8C352
MSTVARYEIRRAGPRFGAEVTGIDLKAGVDDRTAEELRRAFREHKVPVFRGQHLTPAQHVEAVRVFAEPFDHPTAVKDPARALVYRYWPCPTAGRARPVPGTTPWTTTAAAPAPTARSSKWSRSGNPQSDQGR